MNNEQKLIDAKIADVINSLGESYENNQAQAEALIRHEVMLMSVSDKDLEAFLEFLSTVSIASRLKTALVIPKAYPYVPQPLQKRKSFFR